MTAARDDEPIRRPVAWRRSGRCGRRCPTTARPACCARRTTSSTADCARRLLAADADNAVAVVLPDPTPCRVRGRGGAAWRQLGRRRPVAPRPGAGALRLRDVATDAQVTRGLLGAVELRAPEDGVILPHENTMAGPVADRLQVMKATGADLEPIYLVYDGGGAGVGAGARRRTAHDPIAATATPDGIAPPALGGHRPADARRVAADLAAAGRSSPTATTATRPTANGSAAARELGGPGPGTAGWRCSSTPPTTARRCTRSTGWCTACPSPTPSPR